MVEGKLILYLSDVDSQELMDVFGIYVGASYFSRHALELGVKPSLAHRIAHIVFDELREEVKKECCLIESQMKHMLAQSDELIKQQIDSGDFEKAAKDFHQKIEALVEEMTTEE